MARAGTSTWTFLAGFAAGTAAAVSLARRRRRALHPRIIRALPRQAHPAPVVFVPGLCGSQLLRPDGTEAWLNIWNTIGHHDLRLPGTLPFLKSRDDLHPGLLVGTDALLPRAFGFTEYTDVLELLDAAGFEPGIGPGHRYAVFAYDWRRDLVESARHLALRLEGLAAAMNDPEARFHVVGHSMGGMVARYYLRYGGGEPRAGASVPWAGARRIASVVQVATPNAGSIAALGAIVLGERVGFSHTTLAAPVIQRMPSVYQLLPPAGTGAIVDPSGRTLDDDLQDPATWEKFGWGPFAPDASDAQVAERSFVRAALERARAVHEALCRPATTPCPVPVYVLGGDCLLTAARAVAGEGPPGTPPRLEARTRAEQGLLFEPGDGRVTRASLLGSHLPPAGQPGADSGYGETTRVFFGGADHHGLYADPAFQSVLLRLLLQPAPQPAHRREPAAGRTSTGAAPTAGEAGTSPAIANVRTAGI
jgi:pimeloyl-ACP methyl ester carboxylesterase